MRALSAAQERVYGLQTKSVAVRVWITDATATEVDLSDYLGHDWVRSAEWGEDVDSPGMTATVEIARAYHGLSVAPFRTLGRPNTGGVLLREGRAMRIEIAVFPRGMEPDSSDWVEVFAGVIQTVESAADPIRLTARGKEDLLQSTYIEDPAQYSDFTSGEALETVMQSIMDDYLPTTVTLHVPVSPSWQILAFTTEVHSVWDELDKLVGQIGWCLRYLYDDGATEWRLTLYEPDRAGGASVWTFPPSQWFDMTLLSTDLSTIRNAVSVTYGDASNPGADGQPTPETVTAEDPTSTTEYGRRWLGITLDATTNIDSTFEANTLASAVVSDLAWPMAAVEVELSFCHFLQLGDTVTLSADHIRIDEDQEMAVVGYRSSIANGRARTRIQGRFAGAVARVRNWLSMAAQRGVAALQQRGAPLSPADIPAIVREAVGSLILNPDMSQAIRKGGFQVEVHGGPSGFIPDYTAGSATIIGRAKAGPITIPVDTSRIPIGEPRDLVITYLNDRGVRSGEQRLTRTARRPGLGWLDQYARLAGSFAPSTFSTATRGPSFPPDGWDMVVGTWDTDAKQDDGGTLVAPLTGVYALTLLGSVATQLLSQTTPVAYGRRYVSQVALYTDSVTAGRTVTVVVEWLNAAMSVYATDTIFSGVLPATSTWYTYKRAHGTPTTCRYARVRITKAAYSFKVAVDRVLFEEDEERDDQSSRIMVAEDFVGPDGGATLGNYPWALYHGSTDSNDEGPASVTKLSASNWERCGIVSLEVADPNIYPSVSYSLALGTYASPSFSGVPPAGTEMEWVVAMGSGTTDVRAWCGLWQVADGPVGADGELVADGYNCGIGFIAIAGTWYGIVRIISGGMSVNRETSLGVAADTTWRRLGWYYNGSIVIFIVDGQPAGTPQSTTDFGDVGLSPIFGLIASGTDTPSIQVDRVFLHSLTVRT